MALRRTMRWLAVGLLAGVSGCTATPGVVIVPTLPPRAEALSYFPEGSPLVALVRTDPGDGQWRALARSHGLAGIERLANRQLVRFAQLRGLLGHELVVGVPAPGAPPVAVLVTKDGDYLRTLA